MVEGATPEAIVFGEQTASASQLLHRLEVPANVQPRTLEAKKSSPMCAAYVLNVQLSRAFHETASFRSVLSATRCSAFP